MLCACCLTCIKVCSVLKSHTTWKAKSTHFRRDACILPVHYNIAADCWQHFCIPQTEISLYHAHTFLLMHCYYNVSILTKNINSTLAIFIRWVTERLRHHCSASVEDFIEPASIEPWHLWLMQHCDNIRVMLWQRKIFHSLNQDLFSFGLLECAMCCVIVMFLLTFIVQYIFWQHVNHDV